MANEKLGFLKGTQGRLDSLTNTQVREGTFYLTTDSHRLYIGLNGQKQLLNKYIHEYADVNSLPATGNHKGDFAYASAENVLAYFNGTKWQQINPDTRITAVTNTLSGVTGGVNVLTTYENNVGKNPILSNLSFVSTSDGLTITSDGTSVKFTLADFPSYTFDNRNTTFAVNKDKEQIASLKISNGDNVTVTQKTAGANGEITIEAKDTRLVQSSDAVKAVSETDGKTGISVNVEDDNNNIAYGKVYLQGTNGNEVSVDAANNVLNIKAPDLKAVNGGLQLGGKKVNFVSKQQNDLFKITENETENTITFDAVSEHVDSVDVVTNSGYDISLNWDNGNRNTPFKLDPKITYGDKGSTTVNFTDETAILSVYTQKEIDDKITKAFQQQDAMVFKGGVSAKPTGDQENGSTYKVLQPFLTYKVGDIIIASGTESADTGLIPAAQVTWVHVPAGDDEIYSLEFNDTTSSFSLYDGAKDKGLVKIQGDDSWIDVNLQSTNNTSGIFTISHSGVAATETPGTQVTQDFNKSINLNIITSITSDSKGHISGFTKTPVTFTDTHNYIDNVASMFDTSTNTLGVSFEYTDGVSTNSRVMPLVKFTSSADDNLVITPTTSGNITALDFSMVWGDF